MKRSFDDICRRMPSGWGCRLPAVSYFARCFNLSSGYFGELVKAETGRTAQDFIAERVLASAKELLNDMSLTVTQVSERLGFEYPQHFIRFFKRHTYRVLRLVKGQLSQRVLSLLKMLHHER